MLCSYFLNPVLLRANRASANLLNVMARLPVNPDEPREALVGQVDVAVVHRGLKDVPVQRNFFLQLHTRDVIRRLPKQKDQFEGDWEEI